jgi:alkanesulfonate monooxygenase SsuD/methylene tetrahydromethanopterin reductase-like flavin-dependent oxidoreductase (luciferase family)
MNTTVDSAVPFHVGVALKGTGFHPASAANPTQRNIIFDPQYWAQLTQTTEAAGASFVSFEDSLGLHEHGQFDASLVASWVAPQTSRIGLLPTLTVTHTEPFHVSKNVATLDYISRGRAGWQVQVSATAKESRLFGRGRNKLDLPSLYRETEEAVSVVRKLWDSWEDDAEIRDATTGRFIDRNKLHYIDHVGEYFSVKGPSITPRPPQGQPVVAFAGRHDAILRAAVTSGDLLFVEVEDAQDAQYLLTRIRKLESDMGRTGVPLLVSVDLPLLLSASEDEARRRWEELNTADPAWLNADQLRALGTTERVNEQLTNLQTLGFNGVRLQPAENLVEIPALKDLLADRTHHAGTTQAPADVADGLRGVLGLTHPENRYAKLNQSQGAFA